MKALDSAIHHSMPMYEAFDVKTNLGNYLTLNSEHRRLSFTFLRSFDYSTENLIGKSHLISSCSLPHSVPFFPLVRVHGTLDFADLDDK